jgi:hypothetical protein
MMARFLCLWDINNNSKITQKGKRDVEGNVKICLPAAQRILIVPQYVVCHCNMSMQPLKYFDSSLCLWDIKSNSKIAQKEHGKLMEMSKFACL